MASVADNIIDPIVSIIIPSFNRAELIADTLESVLKQSYTNWECIVIDDGSTDNTLNVIKKYTTEDNRFKLCQRDRGPKGAPTCRNIGIDKSIGEYIIFLDSDDLIASFCLRNRVAMMCENKKDFIVFFKEPFINIVGDCRSPFKTRPENIHGSYIDWFLIPKVPWAIHEVIWKRACIESLGGFHEGMQDWQDWELHVRALLKKAEHLVLEGGKADCYVRQHRSDRISANKFEFNRIYRRIIGIIGLLLISSSVKINAKIVFVVLLNLKTLLKYRIPFRRLLPIRTVR